MRLIRTQRVAYSQTASTGVLVGFQILYQIVDPGSMLSREKAQMVRLPACKAVMHTKFMIRKAATAKNMAGPLPMTL